MDMGTVAVIVTSVISILAMILGAKFKVGKDKVTTLLTDVVNAVQDDKVTEEECQKIASDAKAFLES
jgi:uncharacterized protein YpuA (DUF1002 family)